jgi:elongation factor G
VGTLRVLIPDSQVGDVIGDLNKRRGKIMGMDQAEGKRGYSIVEAEVPDSEMSDYVHVLRAISQGRGSYTFYLTGYSEVPGNIAEKIIAEAKKNA